MSFSLKYLFALMAIAAIFTAAIIYRTPFWAVAAVNSAVIVLFVGTIGLWFQRLNRAFWIPFCAVGWFYFVLSLTPQGRNRFNEYMPGTQITHLINEMELLQPFTGTEKTAWERERRILYLFDILNSCSALIAAVLAGVTASFVLRDKRET